MNELLFCHHRATDLFLDRLSAQAMALILAHLAVLNSKALFLV